MTQAQTDLRVQGSAIAGAVSAVVPLDLAYFVPACLPEVPGTGMRAYPVYADRLMSRGARRTRHWFDLGSREGADAAQLWISLDGDPDHAILILTADEQGEVVFATRDRMAYVHE